MIKFDRKKMRARREALHLTRSAFAREAEMHPSSVGQIENGRLQPYDGQIKKIITTLDRLEAEKVL
jgi:predicted transcriptional regulator